MCSKIIFVALGPPWGIIDLVGIPTPGVPRAEDFEVTDEKTETTEKAAPIQYGESRALATPVKKDPPAGRMTGGGGGRPATDIIEAAKILLADRDAWYLVAESVPNAGRFYDGFRGQGAEVRVAATGNTIKLKDGNGVEHDVKTYNVWARIPAGPIVPWKKGGKTSSATPEAAPAESRPPVQSADRRPSNVRPLPTGTRR